MARDFKPGLLAPKPVLLHTVLYPVPRVKTLAFLQNTGMGMLQEGTLLPGISSKHCHSGLFKNTDAEGRAF